MKGHLYKKIQPEGWYVAFTPDSFGFNKTELPLHPYDVNNIREWGQIFDNIEARIKSYSEVEFEIEDFWETGLEEVIKVAKLK